MYLFKYINNGFNRATIVLQENPLTNGGDNSMIVVDETKDYLDCRYISVSKVCWRIFELKIQHRTLAVERLNFHLEKRNTVSFPKLINLRQLVHRPVFLFRPLKTQLD